MAYKHKIRISHILDDVDRGYIKSKEEFKEILDLVEIETFKDHFLEEYDQNKKQEEEDKEEGSDIDEFK